MPQSIFQPGEARTAQQFCDMNQKYIFFKNGTEPIVLVIFNQKSTRGLADLLSFGQFNKSARFFIDYHSKLVL